MLKITLTVLLLAQAGFLRAQEISIVPLPLHLDRHAGQFQLTPDTRIDCTAKSRPEALLLKQYLEADTGLHVALAMDSGSSKDTIQLDLDPAWKTAMQEGYALNVGRNNVLIRASTRAGLFYGIQTLRQLLPVTMHAQGLTEPRRPIPCVSIEDQPSYAWRGLMLDVSRYFFDKEYVKRYLDMMAAHKLNTLHLHLVDDPGWRVQIRKYPKLTEIGGFRGQGATRYGGYYTQDDIREIVDYAAKRHINIVPEIELPAHIQSGLAAYPWLGCTDQQLETPTSCYISREILCAGKESTYQFLEDVMAEVVELFPFKYIHIGGDEAKYDRWKACAHCNKKMKTEGLEEFSELQGSMTRRIESFLLARDRSIIGWDEITHMGLSPQAAVMTWHRPETAAAAAKAGNKVVMALTSHAYFDTPESKLPGEPPAATWLAPISLKKAYNWEPAPAALAGEARKNVLGAHGCVWTDRFMHNPILQDIPALNETRAYAYVEYLSLPRMAALAEVTWTAQAKRSWDNFEQRMTQQYRRYSVYGYHYRVPLPKVDKPVRTGPGYTLTAHCPVEHATICYTTDGTYPNAYSRVYEKPVQIGNPLDFRAVTVVNPRHVSLTFAFPQDENKLSARHGSLVGRWESGNLSAGTYRPVDYDATGRITGNGPYEVTFIYTGGSQRLDIQKVDVILHGKVVASDHHYGTTGSKNQDNTYSVKIQDYETGASYTLRAHIRGDTGNDSKGLVFIKKAE